jgi:hypothetical protein
VLVSSRVKPPALKLTTHLHVVPILRMRGAVSPLPQSVFMVVGGEVTTPAGNRNSIVYSVAIHSTA